MRRLLAVLFGARKSSSSPAPCSACGAREAELNWLREQHDRLLDRLLATAGVLSATRDALDAATLASDAPPINTGDQVQEEDSPESIPVRQQEKDSEEARQWARDHGLPLEATHDV